MSDKIATIVGKRRLDRYFDGSNMEGKNVTVISYFKIMCNQKQN